jgi:vacuolar-type H+-ATPase subunit E/Vma4
MGAELLFEQIKRIDSEEVKELLQSMIDDLEKAAEEEGIGMNEDSEWMYLQVKDDIEEYCGESK